MKAFRLYGIFAATNRQDFETLLRNYLDVLKLQLEYHRELAKHESALAPLESLMGVTIP